MSGKYALVIGNTEYIDPGLAQLSAPGKDTENFARVLRDQNICAFDKVDILLNQPSLFVIEAIDEFFDQKKPDDLLVLYFSGHGMRDELGSLYLGFKNTIRSRLRSTAIKSDYIKEAMDQSRSKRQVLILDCCNSGAFSQGTKAEVGGTMGMTQAFQGYGRFVLTASDATQFAWEGDKVIGGTDNSLFTHFLIKGLSGEADSDGDGRITVDELYDYAYLEISRVTPKQTPTKSSSKQEGEIVLRQNMRAEDIKRVALPLALLDSIENPFPDIRLGAVQQLIRLMNGKNLGLARSAREALEQIAENDDSKTVSHAAFQAVEMVRQAEKKIEEERLAKLEAERLAEEKKLVEEAEKQRIAAEKAEKERIAQTKLKAERLAEEKRLAEEAELQRIAAEKAEKERLAKAKVEAEQLAEEKRLAEETEKQRVADEKVEKERVAKAEREAKHLAEEKRKAEESEKLRADKKAEAERKTKEEKIRQKEWFEQTWQEAEKKVNENVEKSSREKTDRKDIKQETKSNPGVLSPASSGQDSVIAKATKKSTSQKDDELFAYVTPIQGMPLYQSLPASNNWNVWLDEGSKLRIINPKDAISSIGIPGHYIEVANNRGHKGFVEATAISIEHKDTARFKPIDNVNSSQNSSDTTTPDSSQGKLAFSLAGGILLLIVGIVILAQQSAKSSANTYATMTVQALHSYVSTLDARNTSVAATREISYPNGDLITATPIINSNNTIAAESTSTAIFDSFMKPGFESNAQLIYGPGEGNLPHIEDDSVELNRANVDLRDFIVSATFQNPYSATTGSWDYGFLFRDKYGNDQYRLIISSGSEWQLRNQVENSEGTLIQYGQLSNLDTRSNGTNTIWLYCVGEQGMLFINDDYIADIDLSARQNSGDIGVATGFFSGHEINGFSTDYIDFNIWVLP